LLYRNLQTPAASTSAEEAQPPREDDLKKEEVRDGEPQGGMQATEQEEGSPTDDLIGDYTQPEDERTPTRESVRSPPVEHQSVPEPSPAAAVRSQTPPPQEVQSVDEDAPLTPVANTGKRLSRARPMSGHRERLDDGAVLAEGETSLKRAGSGEARAIRGPRGMFSPFSVYTLSDTIAGARGPRPGPGKLGSVDLTASPNTSAGRPQSPSIKDRIAHLESRAGSGTDRFV
jgi:hypothetical protein